MPTPSPNSAHPLSAADVSANKLARTVRAALSEHYAAPLVIETDSGVEVFAGAALNRARDAAGEEHAHRVQPINTASAPWYAIPAAMRDTVLRLWRQHGRPGHEGGELVTELIAGDPSLQRVAVQGEWWLVRTIDGAMGWISADDAERLEAVSTAPSIPFDPGAAHVDIERFVAAIAVMRGEPYVWGGTTATGVDCSGLVQRAAWIASKAWLPRHSRALLRAGRRVPPNPDAFATGDVLVLKRKPGTIDAERRAQLEAQAAAEQGRDGVMPAHGPAVHPMHVAVVTAPGEATHASRDAMAVVVEPLSDLLARYRVLGARRLTQDEVPA